VGEPEKEDQVFRNREDAALQLARRLQSRKLQQPLVLAIPRGGLAVGAALARELDAELDVVLSRKLRAPGQPELAIGAVAEDGRVFRNPQLGAGPDLPQAYLKDERDFQLGLIARRRKLFRGVRPAAAVGGRSVIVTDDGIATGSTMIAALDVVRGQSPHEVIVAVPVASPERLPEIRRHCDHIVCLLKPARFWAIGQFYEDFTQMDDSEAVELLRAAAAKPPAKPNLLSST
jgi:predicted phosphoribosyltransferase